ncbi:Lrp/AsnC family transcriptional regulator [Streptomyces palmae]|uniref:Lrp/AsnC family transcriptional regulator n=1 Tax=Streptomyces palmae TaxID=1701085 RepID=A0A4Z0HB63_9ACTN|nr:Lrp/AsnC family transcriptional regulator [Streptomyces palmae]TGB16173.1 Lrp/AsnC family transcriptional regulator [Streptomyces palmae]
MGEAARSPKETRSPRASAPDSSAGCDAVDRRLLALVQEEGRITLSELGRRVNLSPAAVSDRLRRLETSGIITGYGAQVSPARLGYALQAFVRVDPHAGYTLRHPRTLELIARQEILEVHHVVGEDCWILKVGVADTGHLEEVLAQVTVLGSTTTSVVLSSPVARRTLLPLERATY